MAILSILRRYGKPQHLHDYGSEECLLSNFSYDERIKKFLGVKRQDLIDVAGKYLLDAVSKGETQQSVFGVNTNKLELYIKNGWKIERFSKGLSLNTHNYAEDGDSEEIKRMGELR